MYYVNDMASLQSALESSDNIINIILTDSFQLTYAVLINKGKTVIITSDNDGPYTLTGNVIRVIDGNIIINDGVIIINDTVSVSAYALHLNGSSASGTIKGGRFEGYTALRIENGATIDEISGGEFIGASSAIELFGQNSKIDLISNGLFEKTDATIDRSAFYVDNGAQIGYIVGGTFEAKINSALLLIRGGWVDEISNGTFNGQRAMTVFSDDVPKTGVDRISGGKFTGEAVCVWVRGVGAQINTISNGTFEGVRTLHNDLGSVTSNITGGNFIGSTAGIYNLSTIENIGGTVQISGIINDNIDGTVYGTIDNISGGVIISDVPDKNGIRNLGLINQITGGIIVGAESSISCVSPDKPETGTIGKILGGAFWGKNDAAIILASTLILEPGLDVDPGIGRYRGKDDVIFNDESLVIYPPGYIMSTSTLPVEETQFRYLTRENEDECEGNIKFPCIEFTEEGVFNYTIRETSTSGNGWITDEKKYPVIVTVTDDNGTLTASVEYPEGIPEFTNRYEPQAVCVTLCANKIAIGAPLEDGQFTFGVFDEEGNEVTSATNTTP